MFPLPSPELERQLTSQRRRKLSLTTCDPAALRFFTDIVENTKLLRSQVEESLAELVANGVVVSDSFTGLRALLTPGSKKTQAAARRKHRQPVYDMASAGRWSILQAQLD